MTSIAAPQRADIRAAACVVVGGAVSGDVSSVYGSVVVSLERSKERCARSGGCVLSEQEQRSRAAQRRADRRAGTLAGGSERGERGLAAAVSRAVCLSVGLTGDPRGGVFILRTTAPAGYVTHARDGHKTNVTGRSRNSNPRMVRLAFLTQHPRGNE